ncbi:MAG TPA: hydrogenase nickel incorporation protein HypB [Burkholderiaceae bacterium]|nr:hydrogenase nickel incorporation protein HypB [Burkholderiaceae bacterium]
MCTTCGCGSGETKIEGDGHEHEHVHTDGTVHRHGHAHEGEHAHGDEQHHDAEHDHFHHHGHVHEGATSHHHEHEHVHVMPDGSVVRHAHAHEGASDLHYGHGPAHAHAPGMSPAKMVQVEQDILAKNDRHARFNREFLAERGIFAVNLVSSPGSGKTTLLTESIRRLQPQQAVTVIEGDQQTTHDADRIRATGAKALQINTGKGCHLDASMVERALERLQPGDGSVLFIENVGNLVCPAAFDLGEAHKVVVLSVTEGEDKPLKYPDMFRAASLMLLNKVDLLPYVSFDVAKCIEYARRINPAIEVMQVSATKGDGMDLWINWVRLHAVTARHAAAQNVAALRRRVTELEARLAERG